MAHTLDLYELALLLNYERASTEPRFRHAKLREIASASSDFKTILFRDPVWKEAGGPKTGFVFDKPTSSAALDVPDLPSNMLPTPVPVHLRGLSEKEVETIYWQARGHDGCYKSVTLLQHFFDLYSDSTKLRIRTSAGVEFTTTVSSRVILEMELLKPRLITLSCVLPDNQTYITGSDNRMSHAVIGFAGLEDENISTVLDLASMQFGDAGRGLGGRSTFALESLDKFYDRVERVACGADTKNAKTSRRIGPCADDVWLKRVAKKAKQRWEKRETEPWCGHCGAPGIEKELRKCSACREVYYCDAAHQAGAWPFHKRFCAGRNTGAD